jgi:hypothetical protein
LKSLKAEASAVSRVGAITVPMSMLGLPTQYTNQLSVSAGLVAGQRFAAGNFARWLSSILVTGSV